MIKCQKCGVEGTGTGEDNPKEIQQYRSRLCIDGTRALDAELCLGCNESLTVAQGIFAKTWLVTPVTPDPDPGPDDAAFPAWMKQNMPGIRRTPCGSDRVTYAWQGYMNTWIAGAAHGRSGEHDHGVNEAIGQLLATNRFKGYDCLMSRLKSLIKRPQTRGDGSSPTPTP